MKNLFKSKTSFEILSFLSEKMGVALSLAEISRHTNRDKANTSRELDKLQEEGVVVLQRQDKRKLYTLNPNYPGFPELSALLTKARSLDFEKMFAHTWLMAEDIPNMDPYFAQIWANCFVGNFVKPGGMAYQRIAVIHEGYHLWINFDEADASAVATHLVDRFLADPTFMHTVNQGIIAVSDKLKNFAHTIPEENLQKLTNRELQTINSTHIKLHSEYYQWTWIPAATDMFANILTDRSKDMLRSLGVAEENLNEYLTILTQPTNSSLIKQEQDALRAIAFQVQQDPEQYSIFLELFRQFKEEDAKQFGLYTHTPEYELRFETKVRDLIGTIKPEILDALQEHYANYFYTKFIFTEEQGVYSFEHFLKELVRMVNQGENLLKEQRDLETEQAQIIEQQRHLIQSLKLNAAQKTFFREWGEFMVTKIYRRYAQLLTLYKMSGILEEIGRRLKLSLKETRFLQLDEIEAALLKGDSPSHEEIRQRMRSCVYFADHQTHRFLSGTSADRATHLIRGSEQSTAGITELKGQTGCRGQATGTVKIINFSSEMHKMQQGDILVSISTQPDLLPAMKKAAAFITEQGGVTSHAAIVARELNVPCVIATKIATKVLHDGMRVAVDATKGIVRILD